MFRDDRIDIGGEGTSLDTRVAKQVFGELENYLNRPIKEISQEYWRYREMEEKEKKSKISEEDRGKILDYYRTAKQYLYELIYWEALKSKQKEFMKLYLICRKLKINKLLDFGGGVGGLSIFMAQRSLRCDYLDVVGETSDFAKWRFNQRGLNTQNYSDVESIPISTYDAVIAYDVLEHLFDVEGAVKEIGQKLKNKGYFISRSSFNEGCFLHLAKNKKFQDMKIFDSIMQKYNFVFIGQLKPDYFSQILNNIGFRYSLFGVRIKHRLKYGGNFIIYQKVLF